ncbi:unnamed protein product [Cunninghamella blakesleeana]
MVSKYTLYGEHFSGNCFKVKLLLNHLNVDYEFKKIGIENWGHKAEAFLKMNPVGQIPTLTINETGEHLAESNAILYYLADGSPYFPTDRFERAKVLQWMFFEQYKHEPNIATTRYWKAFLKRNESQEEWKDKLEEKTKNGYAALQLMDDHLSKNDFFANNTYSIADISLYPYTKRAYEGEFDLSAYPNVLKWFERVESQKGFTPFEY